MVIYIPNGDVSDATRPPAFYDGTADFLSECGLSFLWPSGNRPRLCSEPGDASAISSLLTITSKFPNPSA